MIEALLSVKLRQWLASWWDQIREKLTDILFQFVVATLAIGLLFSLLRDPEEARAEFIAYVVAGVVSVTLVALLSMISARRRIAERGEWREDAFVYHRPIVAWAGFRSQADNDVWIEVKVPDAPQSGLVQFRVVTSNTAGVGIIFADVAVSMKLEGREASLPLSSGGFPMGIRMIKGKRAFRLRFEIEPEHDGRHLAIEVLQVAANHAA